MSTRISVGPFFKKKNYKTDFFLILSSAFNKNLISETILELFSKKNSKKHIFASCTLKMIFFFSSFSLIFRIIVNWTLKQILLSEQYYIRIIKAIHTSTVQISSGFFPDSCIGPSDDDCFTNKSRFALARTTERQHCSGVFVPMTIKSNEIRN